MNINFELEARGVETALSAIPTQLAKKSAQAASRNAGTVNTKARQYFEASIERPQESGLRSGGKGSKGRQTGNFTFGARNSGTFRGGVTTDDKGNFGFGYPDTAHADARTSGVWRVLEFGLRGWGHAPSSLLGLLGEASDGEHIMPLRYQWGGTGGEEARSRSTSDILLVGKQYPKHPERAGGGIEGKHFIENAWIESFQTIRKRYEQATIGAIRAAFGRP